MKTSCGGVDDRLRLIPILANHLKVMCGFSRRFDCLYGDAHPKLDPPAFSYPTLSSQAVSLWAAPSTTSPCVRFFGPSWRVGQQHVELVLGDSMTVIIQSRLWSFRKRTLRIFVRIGSWRRDRTIRRKPLARKGNLPLICSRGIW